MPRTPEERTADVVRARVGAETPRSHEGEEITGVGVMGWSVSRHSEPGRKLDLFDKRIARLQGAVKRSEGPNHVCSAAEKLRLAALAVIKAKRALISEYPQRDPDGLQSRKLQEEEQRWSTLSTAEIVTQHGRDGVARKNVSVPDLTAGEQSS